MHVVKEYCVPDVIPVIFTVLDVITLPLPFCHSAIVAVPVAAAATGLALVKVFC